MRTNVKHSVMPTVRRTAKPRAARSSRRPPVARRTDVLREPTMCERCGALYRHRVWRAPEPGLLAHPVGLRWDVCPACAQQEARECYGRVLLRGELANERWDEIRRRIMNVASRASYTQPERRLIEIARAGRGYEVLTTSQKLAHRIGRELEKAFGGNAQYHWSDSDGSLAVVWEAD